mgnify:CR=1 FL=1
MAQCCPEARGAVAGTALPSVPEAARDLARDLRAFLQALARTPGRALRARRRRRRDHAELLELDDRLLDDIGLTRDEILRGSGRPRPTSAPDPRVAGRLTDVHLHR